MKDQIAKMGKKTKLKVKAKQGLNLVKRKDKKLSCKGGFSFVQGRKRDMGREEKQKTIPWCFFSIL